MNSNRSTLAPSPNETIRGPLDAPTEVLRPRGQLHGAYTTLDTLGQGGTALVRRVRQIVLDRDVAIKTPLREHLGPEAVSRVLQEAWVTGALEHPGVVPVHDVVVDAEGCPHIVMRRIEGHTWTQLLNEPEVVEARFGVRDVLSWHLRVLMAVAATLHHAHERGVLHRDLKPDNVMIGAGGEVYLLDWGLAVALDERAARHLPLARSQASLAGTPHYMAPEMARAEGAAFGVPTDVYLLGGLLYAVLTGEPPHPGDDVQEVVDRAARELPSVPTDGPPRLQKLCVQALATEPSERPATAEVFRRAVQAWLEERDADALADAGRAAVPALEAACSAGDPALVPTFFAAVRVPCEQALARAPDHPSARATLDEGVLRMVHFELERGTARAAAAWLAEVKSPPPGLRQRVVAAVEAAAAREAAAASLLADYDLRAGVRTRAFVAFLLGLVFTLAPLAAGRFARDITLGQLAGATVAVLLGVLGLWYWARDSLSRSALNRAFIRTSAVVPCLHLVLILAAGPLGLDVVTVVVLQPLLAATTCLVMAATIEPFMLLPGLLYGATFLGAATFPTLRWEWHVLGNATLTGVALWRWGPTGLKSWISFRRELRRAKRNEIEGAGVPCGDVR